MTAASNALNAPLRPVIHHCGYRLPNHHYIEPNQSSLVLLTAVRDFKSRAEHRTRETSQENTSNNHENERSARADISDGALDISIGIMMGRRN